MTVSPAATRTGVDEVSQPFQSPLGMRPRSERERVTRGKLPASEDAEEETSQGVRQREVPDVGAAALAAVHNVPVVTRSAGAADLQLHPAAPHHENIANA